MVLNISAVKVQVRLREWNVNKFSYNFRLCLKWVRDMFYDTKHKKTTTQQNPLDSAAHVFSMQRECKYKEPVDNMNASTQTEPKKCGQAPQIQKAFISGLPIYISSQGLFFSKTNSWSSAYRSSIFIRMENESSRNTARRFIVYAVCGQVQIGNQLSN